MMKPQLWIGALLVAVGATAWAGPVVYQQLPGSSSNSTIISSTLNNFGAAPGFRLRDNFQLGSDAVISGIEWWGKSNAGGESFTFTFYADAAGDPGAVLLATTGSVTQSPVTTGSFADPVNLYVADLDADFSALGGVTYWLSVFNGAADASWLWLSASAAGDGSSVVSLAPGATPTRRADAAFVLTAPDNRVPEPPTLALVSTLGLCLAGLQRRRCKR